MSGPKSYSPPPMYSVAVFDGKLNEIFQLQQQLQSALHELGQLHCSDKERSIDFDCAAFLQQHRQVSHDLLDTFKIVYNGQFGQDQYNRFNQQIEDFIKQLRDFLEKIRSEKSSFARKLEDYQAYLNYEKFIDYARQGFEQFKANVCQYLEQYLRNEQPEILDEALAQLKEIHFQLQKARFEFGFREKQAAEKAKVENQAHQCEATVNQVRGELADRVLALAPEPTASDDQFASQAATSDEKVKSYIEKIESFIASVTDPERQGQYRQRFTQLRQSHTFKDAYFYVELFEELKEQEKMIASKMQLQQVMAEINQLDIHPSQRTVKTQLVQNALALLDRSRIKSYEMEEWLHRARQFKEENERCIQQDFIREKERQFLKAQLIRCLQSLNYEVMDDMEVIDFEFEKKTDFLMKIPGQSNYINLRFQPDGSFLYNFLIPEAKDSLSMDQKQRKLLEMESTCREFKQVLQDLAQMGLRLDLRSEKPVSEQALIQVPAKYQSRIEVKKAEKKKEKVLQQKYMR
ncbi:MAG: hypothetical protein ONB11_06795 [candidate division KSB1 bacterium]|nr:hypothetical protein [candidate division KSB1 bacterium]